MTFMLQLFKMVYAMRRLEGNTSLHSTVKIFGGNNISFPFFPVFSTLSILYCLQSTRWPTFHEPGLKSGALPLTSCVASENNSNFPI